MTGLDADHLVIGSGAGGAITAALLAEAGEDVTVLEEGPRVEPGELEPFSARQMARQYRNGGLTAALGHPPIAYAEGCCVGGGTEVNSGLYHRPPEERLRAWGMSAEELEPHLEEIERTLAIQPLPGPAPRSSALLAEGAEALGWQVAEVPRWYRYDGDEPRKQSMTQTYLPRAEAAGARVVSGRRVERLTHAGGRVTGAVTAAGAEPGAQPTTDEDVGARPTAGAEPGARTTAGATPDARPTAGDESGARATGAELRAKHVWLCAGAIGSPALLQRSGVRRGIGASLALHPTIKLAARFDEPTDGAADVPVHQVKEFGPDLTLGGSASGPEHVALVLADDWARNHTETGALDRMAVYYAAVRGTGRGRVVSVPGLSEPVVTYRLSRRDVALLRSGLARLALMLFAAGAQTLFPSLRGAAALRDPRDIAGLDAAFSRRRASLMTVHLASSLPMGPGEGTPVDAAGRLRALHGVHVNDASLLPGAPGVNPQGTVMALAARNVARFLEERR